MLPIVGCPAIGSSDPGVKIRIRTSPATLGRKNERRFGEGHLLGDALHLLGGQALRFGKHRQLIALEAAIGEDVEVEVAIHIDGG